MAVVKAGSAPPTDYQTVGFHFNVLFENLPDGTAADVRFQSATGLDVSFDVENWKEGGENRFEHSFPGRRRYADLTLKRGLLLPVHSGLTEWFSEAFQNFSVKPLETVLVQLLDEKGKPLVVWKLAHVWPKSWKIGELNAERSDVLIETLELHYNRFEYIMPAGK